ILIIIIKTNYFTYINNANKRGVRNGGQHMNTETESETILGSARAISKAALRRNIDKAWIGGVGFTFLLAVLGVVLAKAPGLHYLGPLAIAIVLAVIYRQVFG